MYVPGCYKDMTGGDSCKAKQIGYMIVQSRSFEDAKVLGMRFFTLVSYPESSVSSISAELVDKVEDSA